MSKPLQFSGIEIRAIAIFRSPRTHAPTQNHDGLPLPFQRINGGTVRLNRVDESGCNPRHRGRQNQQKGQATDTQSHSRALSNLRQPQKSDQDKQEGRHNQCAKELAAQKEKRVQLISDNVDEKRPQC